MAFNWRIKITSFICGLTTLSFFASSAGFAQELKPLMSKTDAANKTKVMTSHRVNMDDARDKLRHVNELIDFLQIKPGSNIADIGAGDGYTSMYLARATGDSGKVYAINTPTWMGFLRKLIRDRQKQGPLPGVQWLEYPFEAPIPDHLYGLDLVTNILTYHDTLYMRVDRDKMNRNIFKALKPGGKYVVVDHAARPQDANNVGHSLHRIAESFVIDEVQKSGFVLHSKGNFMRYDADNKQTLAWTTPQPNTDRFVLSFVKPL